jgi:hypothetical protein
MRNLMLVQIALLRILSFSTLLASERLARSSFDEQNRSSTCAYAGDQFAHLLSVIQKHRYLEKTTALVQISFKLGLRVQEIALLQIKDVAELGPEGSGQRSFKLKEILALPAAYQIHVF